MFISSFFKSSMIACFILGSFELTNFGSTRTLETCNLLLEELQCSFMISWKDSMKDGFPLFEFDLKVKGIALQY